jgi:hypothetical protein
MKRGLLCSIAVLGTALVAVGAGCGDDAATGGAGGSGGATSATGTSTTKATTGAGMTTNASSAASTSSGGMATCAGYCATIDANCGSPFTQYPSEASCLAICAAFMQGDPGDMSMNTLECRNYHAGTPAQGMPDPHCVHGGPLGGGPDAGNGCGMNRCVSFCRAATAVCTGANTVWGTQAECEMDCMGITDDLDYSTAVTGGDSLACRMYHLSVAAQGGADAATHCPHIDVVSGPCGG